MQSIDSSAKKYISVETFYLYFLIETLEKIWLLQIYSVIEIIYIKTSSLIFIYILNVSYGSPNGWAKLAEIFTGGKNKLFQYVSFFYFFSNFS